MDSSSLQLLRESHDCPRDNEDLVQAGVIERAVRELSTVASSVRERTAVRNWARVLYNVLSDRKEERVDRLLRADAVEPLVRAFLEFGSQSAGSCLASIALFRPSMISVIDAFARSHGHSCVVAFRDRDEIHLTFVASSKAPDSESPVADSASSIRDSTRVASPELARRSTRDTPCVPTHTQ